MKIKSDFVLKKMADQYIVVPVGDYAIDFNGIITLNETAKFMWEKCIGDFSQGDLVMEVMKEYKVDETTANFAVDKFLRELVEANCLE